jgi:hypothetical protein
MMHDPKPKQGIRFYNYYFYGVKEPLTIEARNKDMAREIMRDVLPKLSDKYRESKIVGETVVLPVKGVSEKVVKGVKYIWVGEEKSRNGWLTEYEYQVGVKRANQK